MTRIIDVKVAEHTDQFKFEPGDLAALSELNVGASFSFCAPEPVSKTNPLVSASQDAR